MILKPSIIKICPKCNRKIVFPNAVSQNNFGAKLRTDGRVEGPMLLDQKRFVRCPNGKHAFWSSDAEYFCDETEYWVKNDFNPIHWHSGHVSGVGYLKVPKTFGKLEQGDKKGELNKLGRIELIHGNKMFLQKSTFSIVPEVGSFYFFPNYMMHTVYPFKDSDEERRSISFNANIDENIYDVYR